MSVAPHRLRSGHRSSGASSLAGERSSLPPGLVALAGAGALLGHEIGYLTANDVAGHGYLTVAKPLALLALVAVVWRLALDVVRRSASPLPTLHHLAGAQLVLYSAFEIAERLVVDTNVDLVSTPVLCGLIAQPLVAWVGLRVLSVGSEVLAAIVWRTPATVTQQTVQVGVAPERRRVAQPAFVFGARAPPRSF